MISVHWCRVLSRSFVFDIEISEFFFDKNRFAIRIHLVKNMGDEMWDLYQPFFSYFFKELAYPLCVLLPFTIIYNAKLFISERVRSWPLIIEFFSAYTLKIYVKKLIFEHTKDRIKHSANNLEICHNKWILARSIKNDKWPVVIIQRKEVCRYEYSS